MRTSKAKPPSSSLIYFGVGLSTVTLVVIAYLAISGDQPLGRFGTLAIVGLPVGIASLITGLVTRRREQRR
jgi:hypothetical protein